jgi:DNA-binding transcriptional regulator YhcF (GntR family)
MPEQYVAMRDKFKEDGLSDESAKAKAAAIYNSRHKDHPVTNKPDYNAEPMNNLKENIAKEQEALVPKKTFGEKMGVALSTDFASNHYQGPSGKFAPNPKNALKTPAEGELDIGKMPKGGSYLSQISEAELNARAGKLDSSKVYTHKALTQHLKLHPNSSQHAIEKLEKLGFITKHINGFKRSEKSSKADFSALDQVKANIAKEQAALMGAKEETFLAYDYDSNPDYGTDVTPTSLESVNTVTKFGADEAKNTPEPMNNIDIGVNNNKDSIHGKMGIGDKSADLVGDPKVGVPQIPTLKNFESEGKNKEDSILKVTKNGVSADPNSTLSGIIPQKSEKYDKKDEKSDKNVTEKHTGEKKSGIIGEEESDKKYGDKDGPTTLLDQTKDLAEIAQRQVIVATEALRGGSVTNEQRSRVEAAKLKLKEALEALEKLENSEGFAAAEAPKAENSDDATKNLSALTNFEATQINLERANPELLPDIYSALYIIGKTNPKLTPKAIKVDYLENNAVANVTNDEIVLNYRYANNPKLTNALLQREFQGKSLKTVLTDYGNSQLLKINQNVDHPT